MLSLVIGEYGTSCSSYHPLTPIANYAFVQAFAIGFGARFGLNKQPESRGIYILEYLFIVLAPCAFIAANYVLLGRLASHLDCSKYLLVPARRITLIFIASDISTFLIQVRY